MQRILVIGATGVAGGAGIAAARERYGSDADITGVWYGKPGSVESVEGVNTLIFADMSDPAAFDAIAAQGTQWDWCLYATALGEVGFPIEDSTAEQIAQSNRLSFDPIAQLEARFEIGTLIAYSTFYSLAHQRITYGAMGHSKQAIEDWVIQPGSCRHASIRAGAFRSASSQGIKLLVRRRAKALAESNNELLRSFFTGVKPSEAVENMERAVFEEEREIYGDTHTDGDGLKAAHLALFGNPDCHFMNVCGQRIWPSDTPQTLD